LHDNFDYIDLATKASRKDWAKRGRSIEPFDT